METAIILMSKIPRAGYTKTRLMDPLSGVECAEFHLACLQDIGAAIGRTQIPGHIYYADDAQAGFPLGPELSALVRRHQVGKDLGERMYNAGKELLGEYRQVIFIGADLPDLTAELLMQASDQLSSADVVVGPAADGGYYLLGLKHAHAEIFSDIPWGSAEVLTATLEKLGSLGLSVQLLEEKNDIDIWDDLLKFYERGVTSEIRAIKELAAFALAAEYVDRYRGLMNRTRWMKG